MPALEYPADLPGPQLAPLDPAERRDLTDRYGPRETRAFQRDTLFKQRIQFKFTPEEAAIFKPWIEDTLIFGGCWFASNWSIPLGGVAVRRFVMTTQVWDFLATGHWLVSIDCEVRGRGELPNTPLIYSAPRQSAAALISDAGLTVSYIDPVVRHAVAGVNRSISSGKWYWEDTVNVTQSSLSPFMGGLLSVLDWDGEIADPPIGDTLPLGNGISICIRGNGAVQVNYSLYTGVTGAFSPGDICCVAYDADSGKLWYRRNNDAWSYSGDPAAGTSPASLTTDLRAAGPQVITVSAGVSGILGSVTSNFGETPFAFSPPAGFLPASDLP